MYFSDASTLTSTLSAMSMDSLQLSDGRASWVGRRCGAYAAGFLTAVPAQLCVGNLSPLAISCFFACLEACLRASSTRSCMDAAGLLGAARTTARVVEDSAICPGPLHRCGVQCRVRWMLARRLRYSERASGLPRVNTGRTGCAGCAESGG